MTSPVECESSSSNIKSGKELTHAAIIQTYRESIVRNKRIFIQKGTPEQIIFKILLFHVSKRHEGGIHDCADSPKRSQSLRRRRKSDHEVGRFHSAPSDFAVSIVIR